MSLPPSPTVCKGRISNLDNAIKPDWWKEIFADSMYLKTDGDVVEDPDITKAEIALLEADDDVLQIFLKGDITQTKGEPAKILDLCCGQGRHSIALSKKYKHLQMYGHDQSSFLISLANERAQNSIPKTHQQPTFTVGDCRTIPYPEKKFDLVLVMGNSFGYFNDDQGDKSVLDEIFRVLKPGGNLIIDLTDGGYMKTNFAERSWEWVDDEIFVCRERALSKDGKRLISREVITMTSKGVIRDQIYQERLYSRSELAQILERAGYSLEGLKNSILNENPLTKIEDVVKYDGVTLTTAKELSKRGEDLGMMEQRMVIKAIRPLIDFKRLDEVGKSISNLIDPRFFDINHLNDTPSVSSLSNQNTLLSASDFRLDDSASRSDLDILESGTIEKVNSELSCLTVENEEDTLSFSKLTVILGDTSKSCFGKLDNSWNKEDFETRKNLITALNKLGFVGKNLTIIDKHDSLISTLLETKNSIEFCLNLCDEGFDNDATKELHVPSVLEMLNVPYSGSGPNSLSGVPIPKETYFSTSTSESNQTDICELSKIVKESIGYPAFVKPVKGDNSLGITQKSLVNDRQELGEYLQLLDKSLGIRDVIVQEYLSGTEYGVGMIGNPEIGFYFLPILEVDYSKILNLNLVPILGFESKWDPTSPYWSDIQFKKSNLSLEKQETLKLQCVRLFKRFGLRDYGRFDFRSDGGEDGEIKLLEVNPNPGWCWDGKLAHMAKMDSIEYKDLLMMIIKAADLRLNPKKE